MRNKKQFISNFIVSVFLILALSSAPTAASEKSLDLKVLTYNTHLFEDSAAGYWSNDTVYKDSERKVEIKNRLHQCGADIIAMQEVWGRDNQTFFIEQLKEQYPYSYTDNIELDPYPKNLPQAFSVYFSSTNWRYFNPIWGLLCDLGLLYQFERPYTGSGLILLSKYPLSDFGFKVFAHTGNNPIIDFVHHDAQYIVDNADIYSCKGVLTTTANTSVGKIRIGITHAFTDVGGIEQPNIKLLTEETNQTEFPAIIMGDLNVHKEVREKTYEYFHMISAKDAWLDVHKDSDAFEEYTFDNLINTCGKYFSPNAKDNTSYERDRIDYIFYKESKDIRISPHSMRVIKGTDAWTIPIENKPFDCSDHYPVEATFKITKNF